MEINKKRYRDLDTFFKKKFNKKIIKLPVDAGFSCPNRDGKISNEGCIFCSESGSGEWTYGKVSIRDQLYYQKSRLSKPGRDEGYIAYFQNFTNTYASLEKLKNLYYEALSFENIEGLFIATRADSISDELIDFLSDLSKETFLVIELGMQSVNERTIKLINRGYSHKVFDKIVKKLKSRGINILSHLIIGLPYEKEIDYIEDINYINYIRPWGIKIHNLYIEKGSRLLDFYRENKISYSMDLDLYINIVVDMLRRLDPSVVINRLTGDGIKDQIIYPAWAKNKAKILTSIDKKLKDKNYRQGDLWH